MTIYIDVYIYMYIYVHMFIHTFIHSYMHLGYWIFCVGSYLHSSIESSNVLFLKPFWSKRSNRAID